MIAIGNGTASRESEMFVADMIKETSRDVHYVIVSDILHLNLQQKNIQI